MNIILINHYAGSDRHGMEYRPYYMAKRWVQAGCQVTVVPAFTTACSSSSVICSGR